MNLTSPMRSKPDSDVSTIGGKNVVATVFAFRARQNQLSNTLGASCSFCTCVAALLITFAGLFDPTSTIAQENSVVWLTGAKLRQDLERPFSGNWTYAELREMLTDVATDRRISIVLDRRLDPSVRFPFAVRNVPLRTGLSEFARTAKGELSLPANFVYLGPPSAARQLRTLMELRKAELSSKDSGIPDRRRAELQSSRKFQWHDLETPRQVLENIAAPFRLTLKNEDQIPHDLWAAAVLPDVSLVDSLSVVLIQFDLTFRWTNSGDTVELIPIPDHLSVERKHHPKMKLADAMALIALRFPDLTARIVQSDIVVNGLVEDHEAISSLLRGENPVNHTKGDRNVPLGGLFTFRAEQPVPLSAIMKKLEESDIRFEYNAQDLKAAGIDLEQALQPDVKNVTIEEFFKTIFGPARLDFEIDRQTVKLKPKRSATSQQ